MERQTLKSHTIGGILGEAFRLYRKSWASLMAIAAVFVFPLTLIQYWVNDLVVSESPSRAEVEVRGVEALSPTFWRVAAGAAVIGILTLLIYQVVQGAIARAGASLTFDQPLRVGDAYRYGFARLGSILLVTILTCLAVLGGLVLLIVPGIIIMVRLSVGMPALVVEGKRGRAALRRSWELTRGRAWHTLGALFISAVLISIASAVLGLPFADSWFGRAVAASVGSAITMPYTALVGVVLYLDLRARHEETDADTVRREFEAAGVAGA